MDNNQLEALVKRGFVFACAKDPLDGELAWYYVTPDGCDSRVLNSYFATLEDAVKEVEDPDYFYE